MAQRAGLSMRAVPSIPPSAVDVYSQRFAFGTGFDRGNKENFGPRGSTDLSPIDSEDEEETNESFTPINPRTWAREAPSFLQSGTLLPAPRRPVPRSRTQTMLKDSNALPPYDKDEGDASPGFAPECDHFLKMMDEKLQINVRRPTPGGVEQDVAHVRSTSSSYPSPGDTCTRIQSPDSIMRQNRLSITDLSRITQANGRLSILRSSSSLSEQQQQQQYLQQQQQQHQHEGRPLSVRDVLAESSSAIAQWQKELRQRPSTYLQYELADSAEALPSSSISEQQQRQQHGPASSAFSPNRMLVSPSLTWENLRAIRAQYDGTQELTHPALRPDPHLSSPAPDAVPSYAQLDHEAPRPAKRKASIFSIRSISIKSLTKRPRLGLRRWANSVYEHGSHRLRVARQRFREHAEMDRRAFEAWRARRHRRDEDPAVGAGAGDGAGLPGSKSCGAIPQRGNDEWWRDGVGRFEAPKWMAFLPGASSASALKA